MKTAKKFNKNFPSGNNDSAGPSSVLPRPKLFDSLMKNFHARRIFFIPTKLKKLFFTG